jgi:hypothetical protein
MDESSSSAGAPLVTLSHGTAILIVICLALLSMEISINTRSVSFDAGLNWALDTMAGRADPPEWQNRVLFPLFLLGIRALGHGLISIGQVWRIARLGAAVFAYLGAYFAFVRITRDLRFAVVAIALITYGYLWTTMSAGWEAGGDFFDIFFLAMFALCSIQKNYLWMLVAVVMAASNRESALFGGIVWACVAYARERFTVRALRDYAFGLFCVLLAALTVYLLRALFAPGIAIKQSLGIITVLVHWRWLLMPFGSVSMIAAAIFPLAWIALHLQKPLPKEAKGLFWATLICGVITGTFGRMEETRIWVPCLVLAVTAIILGLANDAGGMGFSVVSRNGWND